MNHDELGDCIFNLEAIIGTQSLDQTLDDYELDMIKNTLKVLEDYIYECIE